MPLKPVPRRSVTEDVFDQIAAEVLSGDVAVGEALPSERRLAEVLGVSRPSVREALKRLGHAGLVDVRQGDATTVRDFRRSAGMDLLPQLLMSRGTVDIPTARSVMEIRLHVGPFVARLAAERGGAELSPALSGALDDLAAQPDPVARQYAALAFWDVVVDGADSIALRLMYNSLRASYEPVIDAMSVVMDAEVSNHNAYRALARAITAGRSAAAAKAAADLLRPATEALLDAMHALEESP
jgi:GntR family transcriptional regulator, transcriptional repressor for pyruvate dehydrogenase complex